MVMGVLMGCPGFEDVFASVSLLSQVHLQLAAAGAEPAWQLAARLVRRDGLSSLYAGFAPRLLHLSIWSTALVSVYEWLRITCRRPTLGPRE